MGVVLVALRWTDEKGNELKTQHLKFWHCFHFCAYIFKRSYAVTFASQLICKVANFSLCLHFCPFLCCTFFSFQWPHTFIKKINAWMSRGYFWQDCALCTYAYYIIYYGIFETLCLIGTKYVLRNVCNKLKCLLKDQIRTSRVYVPRNNDCRKRYWY